MWYLIEIFRLFGTVSINKAKAIADMKAVEGAGRTFGTRFGSILKKIGTIAKVAFIAVGVAAAGIFVAAIKKAADFELGMAKVKAISGATAEEFEALTAEAKRLGLVTAQTMTDIAEGMEQFSRAGFTATETIAAMSGAVALAESQTMGLGAAVAITAAILNQMHLPAEEAERVVNALAAAASSSATTVETLSESMKYLGPAAQRLGVPLEEALAIIGKLGDAGIKGGFATRAFSTALGELASPTEEAAEVMEDLGIKYFDANGEFIGITNTVGILEEAFVGMTVEQKEVALGAMFTGAAVRVFSTLLGVGADELHNYQEEITDTTVAFDQQAAMIDTVSGQWKILKGSIELLLVTIGSDMLPILQKLMNERIIPLVNSVTKWIEVQGGLIPSLHAIGQKIRKEVPILGTLADLIVATFKWMWENKSAVIAAFVAIGAAMVAMKVINLVASLGSLAALLSPTGILLVGLALLAGGFVLARKEITEFNKVQQQAVTDAKNLAGSLGRLTDSAEDLEKAGAILQGAINFVGSSLIVLHNSGQMSIITLSEISDKMEDLRERVLDVPIAQMASTWREGVRSILEEYSAIVPGIEDIMGEILVAFDAVAEGFEAVGDAAADSVDPMQAHKDALEAGRQALEDWRAKQAEATDETVEGTEAVNILKESLAELEGGLAKTEAGSYAYAQALMDLQRFHEDLVAAAKFLEDQNVEVSEGLKALIAATAKYADAQKGAAGAVSTFTQIVRDAWSGLADFVGDTVGKMLRGVIDYFRDKEQAAEDHAERMLSIEENYSDDMEGLQGTRQDKFETAELTYQRKIEDIETRYRRALQKTTSEDTDERARIETRYRESMEDAATTYARRREDIEDDYTDEVGRLADAREDAIDDEVQAYEDSVKPIVAALWEILLAALEAGRNELLILAAVEGAKSAAYWLAVAAGGLWAIPLATQHGAVAVQAALEAGLLTIAGWVGGAIGGGGSWTPLPPGGEAPGWTPTATGGLVVSPAHAFIGEGRYEEAILPLNEEVYARMGTGIAEAGGDLRAVEVNVELNVDHLTADDPHQIDVLCETLGRRIGYRLRGLGLEAA